DVPTFSADDAPFHVVRRELDEGDGRLGRMRGCNALERVRDEVAGTTLGLCSGLLLHLPDLAGELVTDEILGGLEEVLLRLGDGHAREALELGQLPLLCLLQLRVERLRRFLAIRQALLAA